MDLDALDEVFAGTRDGYFYTRDAAEQAAREWS